MRYLGLDVGKKSIGVAVGELITQELTTLRLKEGSFYQEANQKQVFGQIKEMMNKEQADAVVVGLPLDANGSLTEEAALIKKFAKNLEDFLNISVHFINETLTTFMAKDILEGQGLAGNEVEQRIDQMSASLILQQFIEENALV